MDTVETDTGVVEAELERRGWVWRQTEFVWVFEQSRPLAAESGRDRRGCLFAPTEIDLGERVVYPPCVTYAWELGEALEDVTGHRQTWVSAAEATGLYDGHLAGAALFQSIELPEDDNALVVALDVIESWRWPNRLPAAGFGGRDTLHGTIPADLSVLLEAVQGRPGWEVYPSPVDGQPLTQPIWPAFRFRTGAQLRPDTDGDGYLAWDPDPAGVRLRTATAADMAARLEEIETW